MFFSPLLSLNWTVLICDAENHKHTQVCGAPLVARPHPAPGLARQGATSPTEDHQERRGNLIQTGGGVHVTANFYWTKTCAEEEKKKKKWLWQNILKALLGGDWLIASSRISCQQHRQQVHSVHLYDNIYTALTGGAEVFCEIQQLNTTKWKRLVIWKMHFDSSQGKHGRKRKWCQSALKVLLFLKVAFV